MGRTSPDQANSPFPSICPPPSCACTNTAWQRVGLEKYKIETNQIPLTPPISYHFEPTWVSTVADGTPPISILPCPQFWAENARLYLELVFAPPSLTISFCICKIRQGVNAPGSSSLLGALLELQMCNPASETVSQEAAFITCAHADSDRGTPSTPLLIPELWVLQDSK